MSLPLIFRPEVRSDVEDAYLWYERQRAGLGDDFLASVDRALDRIGRGPTRTRLSTARFASFSPAVSRTAFTSRSNPTMC